MTKTPLTTDVLDDLPNLGKTTVMWLRAVGIRNVEGLRDRGIFWAYDRMQARGFRVTTAVLFSLEGALQDRPWRSFTDSEKNDLLKRLDRASAKPDTSARPVPNAAPRKGGTSGTRRRSGS